MIGNSQGGGQEPSPESRTTADAWRPARRKSPDAGIRAALLADPKRSDQELAKEFKCHPLRVDRIRRSLAAKKDGAAGADLFGGAE